MFRSLILVYLKISLFIASKFLNSSPSNSIMGSFSDSYAILIKLIFIVHVDHGEVFPGVSPLHRTSRNEKNDISKGLFDK